MIPITPNNEASCLKDRKMWQFLLFASVLGSGTGVNESQKTENKELEKNPEHEQLAKKLETKFGNFSTGQMNEHDRIKKLEEEYSRRVKDIKERQMKQKAQVAVSKNNFRDFLRRKISLTN